jgi:lysophospholipase L1-like esterase
MNHMTATGVSGVDLYVRYQGKWKWLAVGRPSKPLNETQFFTDIGSESREYILYLPLYNPVHKIELGIPDPFTITPTPVRKQKPIVFYGTSITQGGCASRPGMSYTAILGRWLDHPVINLGFSGNGIMEAEMMDLLCELDPAIFVLDNLPNMNLVAVQERSENGFRKLLKAHPQTPIVVTENILYCDAYLVPSRMERFSTCNALQFQICEKLKKEGFNTITYIKGDNLIGTDSEATVDGVHLTDLGYMRFSENIVEPLRKVLEK